MRTSGPDQIILGEAPEFMLALEHVSSAARLSKPVLILGERGTGKELFASRVHFLSPRWGQPLVKLNCAALTESILESELFGHEAGAFTGANKRHIGRFERAHQGTLVLDELGTIPARMQEKILRVIEYGEFERVGGTETVQVDVRIVGATNADLPAMARRDEFRSDLLDRLAFDVVWVPPLRVRREDIELLANHFAVGITAELGRSFFAGFSEHAEQQLLSYPWPGNVRELKNAVERSVYRNEEEDQEVAEIIIDPFAARYESLELEDTDATPEVAVPQPNTVAPAPNASEASGAEEHAPQHTRLKDRVAELEQQMLLDALQRNNYHQGHAAEALDLTYHQFRAYLKKHQLRSKPPTADHA